MFGPRPSEPPAPPPPVGGLGLGSHVGGGSRARTSSASRALALPPRPSPARLRRRVRTWRGGGAFPGSWGRWDRGRGAVGTRLVTSPPGQRRLRPHLHRPTDPSGHAQRRVRVGGVTRPRVGVGVREVTRPRVTVRVTRVTVRGAGRGGHLPVGQGQGGRPPAGQSQGGPTPAQDSEVTALCPSQHLSVKN